MFHNLIDERELGKVESYAEKHSILIDEASVSKQNQCFFNSFPKEVSHLKERKGYSPVSRWEMNFGWL
ncbi:hypothetical protein CH76_08830 [Lysinibacillus sp. BF-4]|nr:hypothetical protein CH76_08830 [Lysinibacillus sp. BF-4]